MWLCVHLPAAQMQADIGLNLITLGVLQARTMECEWDHIVKHCHSSKHLMYITSNSYNLQNNPLKLVFPVAVLSFYNMETGT